MDFLNDKTAAILGYAFQNNLLPAFVKEASMPTKEDVEGLKDNAFANVYTREFPCHTKEATVLSALYAAANGEDEEILEEISKKASVYGILDEVTSIFNHFDEQFEKLASTDEEPLVKFALSLEDEEGNISNYYNTSTKEDTLLSIKHLEQDFNNGGIALPVMRKIAKVICDSVKEFDITPSYVPSVITKYAASCMPNVATALSLIELRKQAHVNMEDYYNVLEKLANDISNSDMTQEAIISIADNTAEQLFILDKAYNIKYASDQPDPYDVIFNGPTFEDLEKFAAEHVRILDIPIPAVDIINVSEEKVTSMFNKKASSIILDVKNALAQETSLEKTAYAQTKLEELTPDASKVLLQLLADTGW